MAREFSVKVDFAHRLAELDLGAGFFPLLAAKVEALAQAGVSRWQEAVHAAPGLWIGEKQAYMASIRARQVGPYEWEIVSDYKFVEDIESGRPAYDLKRMLDTSLKVRVNKKGQRYLIIPMRHNTPGFTAHAPAMPPHVYAEAKELSRTRITGHYRRLSGTGAHAISTRQEATVTGRRYVWGARLPAGLAPKLADHHATDPYAGMVRMRNATGGSKYMTFRVMKEGSPKWIIPARPGLWLAKGVAESLQRTADKDLPPALAQDLGG